MSLTCVLSCAWAEKRVRARANVKIVDLFIMIYKVINCKSVF